MFPLSIHNYFEMLALFCSIVFWQNIKNTVLRWFVPYLIFIIIIELIGRYYSREIHRSNAWLYNISVPIEYLFFTFIFQRSFVKKFNRNLARLFLFLFSSFALITILIRGITVFNTAVLITGSFFMIIFSVLFFIELYNRPGYIYLQHEPIFWLATGVLLFNAGEFSYDLLSNFFFNYLDSERAIFRSINKYLNLLLYLCISISFIWKKKSVT